jgi:hypothetical protein
LARLVKASVRGAGWARSRAPPMRPN